MQENSYIELLSEIKQNVVNSRIQAVKSVNTELVSLYWNIGKLILERQKENGWGKSIVEKLSIDLQMEYPQQTGFSARNLWDMRRFYEKYQNQPKLRQLVAEIPWGHHLLILNKIGDFDEAHYYIKASSELGWSRNVLLNQIKADLYHRALPENKHHNFNRALPVFLAEQADEAIKSSYNLEFLGLRKEVLEKELENKMIEHIRGLLLELGYGFAFLGSQYKLKLGNNEYFVDLLFFHRKLQCLIAIELKAGKFEPEYAAKLNYYLEVLDDTVRMKHENPSIGILLCAEQDNLEVEYALRIVNKPIGVSKYELTQELPKELKGELPEIKEIKKRLMKK